MTGLSEGWNPSPIELAWAAGILEGEGCFFYQGTPSVKLGMNDADIVHRTASVFKGGSISVDTSRQNPHIIWKVCSYNAIECMKAVLPYMGIRRTAKIKECLAKFEAREVETERRKTECQKGHVYADTGVRYKENGWRVCKECARGWARDKYRRQKHGLQKVVT